MVKCTVQPFFYCKVRGELGQSNYKLLLTVIMTANSDKNSGFPTVLFAPKIPGILHREPAWKQSRYYCSNLVQIHVHSCLRNQTLHFLAAAVTLHDLRPAWPSSRTHSLWRSSAMAANHTWEPQNHLKAGPTSSHCNCRWVGLAKKKHDFYFATVISV